MQKEELQIFEGFELIFFQQLLIALFNLPFFKDFKDRNRVQL